jgi:hypothetical protein
MCPLSSIRIDFFMRPDFADLKSRMHQMPSLFARFTSFPNQILHFSIQEECPYLSIKYVQLLYTHWWEHWSSSILSTGEKLYVFQLSVCTLLVSNMNVRNRNQSVKIKKRIQLWTLKKYLLASCIPTSHKQLGKEETVQKFCNQNFVLHAVIWGHMKSSRRW